MSGPAHDAVALVEVTDTLRLPYVTGIQRTVRRVIANWPEDGAIPLVPVVHTGRSFRRLTDEEDLRLRTGGVAPAPSTSGLRRVVASVPGARRLRDLLRAVVSPWRHRRWAELLVTPRPGDVLFDLEATWWSPGRRDRVLPALRADGVAVVTVVYDLLLLDNPEWFDPVNRSVFVPWARAQLAHADLVLCYSDFVAATVRRHAGARQPRIARFVPGADAVTVDPVAPPGADGFGRFVLVLGTVEPRKNVDVVVDACEVLWQRGSDARLLVVGREGWEVSATARRLRSHPEHGRRLVWLESASDAEVEWLYRRAAVVAVPSWAEGYGLPVVEARRHGARVVSSTGGALAEIGDDGVVYVDPGDVGAWVDALGSALDQPDPGPAPGVPAATWAEAARQIADAVADLTDTRPP